MQWSDLFAALALMLMLEGILPFLNPDRYRKMLEMLEQISDTQLRSIGFAIMLVGAVILTLVRSGSTS
ncbi:MAG TPA: DUF2065 domain-containing protein [Gammaproteobacteria bacterium]|nr:DUF2065 domain-containing protein [Gammaproteobacteria bacterium]